MATEYGKRLRQARKYAGLTQEQLSKITGITQSTISSAEQSGLSSTKTVVYAKACGVNPMWLDTGEGDMRGTDAPTPARSGHSHQADALAALFDTLPEDPIVRATAWARAADAILQAQRELQPSGTPAPTERRKKQRA